MFLTSLFLPFHDAEVGVCNCGAATCPAGYLVDESRRTGVACWISNILRVATGRIGIRQDLHNMCLNQDIDQVMNALKLHYSRAKPFSSIDSRFQVGEMSCKFLEWLLLDLPEDLSNT
jgi:hypothetical protein